MVGRLGLRAVSLIVISRKHAQIRQRESNAMLDSLLIILYQEKGCFYMLIAKKKGGRISPLGCRLWHRGRSRRSPVGSDRPVDTVDP